MKEDIYEQRGWPRPENIGKLGKFMMLPKDIIEREPEYQREQSRQKPKIKKIQETFNWPSFGILTVSKRGEKYFCIDGSGRLTAVLGRPDIQLVPCMVYSSETESDEANIFIFMNKVRSVVSQFDLFQAKISSGDSIALSVEKMANKNGRTIARGASGTSVACISVLMKYASDDLSLLFRCFSLACEISYGESIDGRMLNAIWCSAKRFGFDNVFDSKSRAKLKKVGHLAIMRSVCNHIALSGAGIGAEKGASNGILDILNKGRSANNRLKME